MKRRFTILAPEVLQKLKTIATNARMKPFRGVDVSLIEKKTFTKRRRGITITSQHRV